MGFKFKNTSTLCVNYNGDDLMIVHRKATLKQTLNLEALQLALGAAADSKKGSTPEQIKEAKREQERALSAIVEYVCPFIQSLKGRDEKGEFVEAAFGEDVWATLGQEGREEFAVEHFGLLTEITKALAPEITKETKKKSETA